MGMSWHVLVTWTKYFNFSSLRHLSSLLVACERASPSEVFAQCKNDNGVLGMGGSTIDRLIRTIIPIPLKWRRITKPSPIRNVVKIRISDEEYGLFRSHQERLSEWLNDEALNPTSRNTSPRQPGFTGLNKRRFLTLAPVIFSSIVLSLRGPIWTKNPHNRGVGP